jgi:quercetin dioxygenase-like cupin family protein
MDTKLISSNLTKIFPTIDKDFKSLFLDMLEWPKDKLLQAAEIILDKPYGNNNIIQPNGNWGLSYVVFKPKRRTSLHYHDVRTEFFYVKSGTLTLESNGNKRIIRAGETGFSTPGIEHSLINESDESELHIIEIFSPALLNDKVRVSDLYERTLGSVGYKQ